MSRVLGTATETEARPRRSERAGAFGGPRRKVASLPVLGDELERETGVEPATSTLARWRSLAGLRPRYLRPQSRGASRQRLAVFSPCLDGSRKQSRTGATSQLVDPSTLSCPPVPRAPPVPALRS